MLFANTTLEVMYPPCKLVYYIILNIAICSKVVVALQLNMSRGNKDITRITQCMSRYITAGLADQYKVNGIPYTELYLLAA